MVVSRCMVCDCDEHNTIAGARGAGTGLALLEDATTSKLSGLTQGVWGELLASAHVAGGMGWLTGLEPATTGITIRDSTN